MGDELDAFDLPRASQSGEASMGTISESVEPDREHLEDNQASLLNNALQNYYGRHADFIQLESDLNDLGYSDNQVQDISVSAHQERIYRIQHNGEPSDLTLNQLEFLSSQSGFEIGQTTIRTDDEGRQYVDDRRVRDIDGVPSKLYLPIRIPFNPLTNQQETHLLYDESIINDITLENPDITDTNIIINTDISQHNIEASSQLITQYLASRHTDQDRLVLRRNIQALPGLENTQNIREKLLQLFTDIDNEQQFRLDNDGRPRGLTAEEWEHIDDNSQSLGYFGQPILTTQSDPPVRYFFTGTGYTIINDTYSKVNNRTLTPENNRQLDLYATDYLTNTNNDPLVLSQNMLSSINYDQTDPSQFSTRLEIEDIAEKYEAERMFRENNGGRPSQISVLQYEFMLNHSLSPLGNDRVEPRYTGEPLTIQDRNGVNVVGFHSYDSNIPELIMIPTDDIINSLIDNGVYTRPLDTTPDPDTLLPPDSLITPLDIQPPQTRLQDVLSQLTNGPITNPIFTGSIVPPISGPPIVPGTTIPVDPITGDAILVPTPAEQVERYEQFFNDNQSLYVGFRNTFRDLLPVFTGATGGYFALSIERIKDKSLMRSVIIEEQRLLEILEAKIDNRIEGLVAMEGGRKSRERIGGQRLADVERLQRQLERNPGSTQIPLALEPALKSLENIKSKIQRLEDITKRLESEIDDTQRVTGGIINKIERLINQDYELLNDIRRHAPQILTGISVGTTLGLVLSGYLFPTYADIDDPYIMADNVEYNKPIEKDINIKRSKEVKKPMPDEIIQPAPLVKVHRVVNRQFIPTKDNGSRPLSFTDIQSLKSTLNKEELNNLKGKYLVFGNDNSVNQIPTDDKCKQIIGNDNIFQRPIHR